MNLYLISQEENNDYDTYSDAVVAAPDEAAARLMHPSGDPWPSKTAYDYKNWASTPEAVKVTLIGVAAEDIEPGVILASYHAG